MLEVLRYCSILQESYSLSQDFAAFSHNALNSLLTKKCRPTIPRAACVRNAPVLAVLFVNAVPLIWKCASSKKKILNELNTHLHSWRIEASEWYFWALILAPIEVYRGADPEWCSHIQQHLLVSKQKGQVFVSSRWPWWSRLRFVHS